jgi:nucleoside-diphosphate-sugar epimerase
VDDLAAGIVAALASSAAERREYNVSGRAALSLDATIAAAAKAAGKRRTIVHVPLSPVAAMLRAFECLRLPIPLKSEQVLRLAEDKAFAHDDASRDFGFAPRAFEGGIAEEALALGMTAGAG